MSLTRPHASQIIDSGIQLDTRIAQLAKPAPASGYFRKVHCVLPVVDTLVQQAIATYSYTTLYPSALAFDQENGDIFILRSPLGTGSTNSWVWVSVYDGTTFARKTMFAITNVTNRETLVIKRTLGVRYLYTASGASNTLERVDIDTLPGDLVQVTTTTTGIPAFLQSTFNPGSGVWTVSVLSAWKDASRKGRFFLWDEALTNRLGVVNFPLNAVGDYGDYLAFLPKAQGMCAFGGGYAFGVGGDYNEVGTGDPVPTDKQQGVILCAATGEITGSYLCKPDLLLQKFRDATGDTGMTVCENEGIASFGGELYALWSTINPGGGPVAPALDNFGLLITKEFSQDAGRIDCSDIASSYQSVDVTQINAEIQQSLGSTLVSPVDETPLDSFADIVAMMRAAGLSRFCFDGTGQSALVDLNLVAVDVLGHTQVIFESLNGSTFLVTVEAAQPKRCKRFSLSIDGTVQADIPHPRFWHQVGAGSPEGVVTAPVGVIYSRTDGVASMTLYVKESGTSSTGWVAK